MATLDKGTVLCCDDESEIVDLVAEEFESMGYQAIKARDGIEAIDLLKTNEIDFIVTDMVMPKADGREILTFVKSHAEQKNIPVIFLTGFSKVDEKSLLDEGASAVFTKPVDIDRLLEFVAEKSNLKRIS